MNKLLRKLPLQAKLLLIGLIPFGFLVYLTIEVYRDETEKLRLLSNYKEYIEESANISGLIYAMQEERKFSFDYAITKNMHRELVLQRPETDAYIHKLVNSDDPALEGITEFTKLGQLDSIRKRIDTFTIPPDQVMHYYSNLVFRLNTLNTLPPANTPYLEPVYKDLVAQKLLCELTTYQSIIRSNVYNVLYTKQYMYETLFGTLGTYDVYKSYEAELLAKASPQIKEEYNKIRATTALKPTMEYLDKLFTTFVFEENYSAADWWKVSNEGAAELQKFQNSITERLNSRINEIYEEEQSGRTQTFIFLMAALLCVIAIVIYIVAIISQSLRKLRKAAEKIADGQTGIDLKPESKDVIGSLAKSIIKIDTSNQAITNAANAIGKGDFTVDVQPRGEHDVLGNAIVKMKTELQQYNNAMESLVAERTEELARSNADLQQFAHVASHDLKEPLRKISMFSNILSDEQGKGLTDKGKVYLNKIKHSALRMSGMIEGVLAYSTITVNEPPFEVVDLNSIMEGVLSDLELVIIQKEANVTYTHLPPVKGIQLQLHQLFYNLVNNALKFSRNDVPPVITVSNTTEKGTGKSRGSFLHITVKDNGIGFNPAYADRMFGVFFRLNSKDDYEGTGLGLALCRKIVHRHGGEIYAESVEGEGATFHVLLPV